VTNPVSIKDFVDVGDANAPIGSQPWCRASHVELCAAKRKLDWEVRHLKYGLLEFKRDERWRQLYDNKNRPFKSWEAYVRHPEPNGLGMPPESAKAVIEAINDAELLGDVLGEHGGKREGAGRPKFGEDGKHGTNQPCNTRLKYGTAEYWLARFDRAEDKDLSRTRLTATDFAELAAKVRAYELSANAAAIEAGFRKKPTQFEIVLRLWPKLTPKQRKQIIGMEIAP
jgi:hypothetical protein